MGYGGGGDTTAGFGAGKLGQPDIRNGKAKPILEKTQSVGYGTTNQIFAISSDTSASASNEAIPSRVDVANNGGVPIVVLSGYETYSDETSGAGATRYLHTMLMPGETFSPPVRSLISTEAASTQFDGTAVDNVTPASVMYVDSTAKTTEGFADDDDTTITFDDAAAGVAHLMFRENDLIRLDDEVCRIKSIVDTAGDGAYTPAHFVVERAVHGTAKADHTNNTAIRLPFFNAYHDFDKYSVSQTDLNGKFKCSTFPDGLGRATSGVQGIVPGSVAIKFYTEGGYQSLGLHGLTSATHSGLSASTNYALDIQVDAATNFDNLTFTTDSSNLRFGGTNGIIEKIQDALDTQYYTSGNLFEKSVKIGIVDGDLRFSSGSNLSTSAIALTAEDGSDASFFGTGRIPAVGSINAAVASRLPDDVIYNNITYLTSPNTNVFMYDDGLGNLFGKGTGTINYETGAIDFRNAPPNAEFVYSVTHSSAFSGKLNEGTAGRINSLKEILVNTPSQKWNGSVNLKTF